MRKLLWKHRGSTKFEHQSEKKWLTVSSLCRTKTLLSNLKKMRKTNTLKATKTWLNVWQTWATEKNLNLKLEEYENEQLEKMLQIYTEIRTKDGFEYKLESLKSMLAALDHYLKEHDYKYSIIQDREFHESKLVLEGKVSVSVNKGKARDPMLQIH